MRESEIRPRELFDRYLEIARRDARRLAEARDSFVHVACPGCGADDPRPELEKEGFRYASCGRCASLYATPRPDAELLGRFYADAESVRFWSSHFYRETAEARRERMFRPRAQLAAELADRHGLPATASLLDVGSGFGIFLEEAQATGRFGRVTGLEPSPDLAETSRARGFEVLELPAERAAGAARADLATCFEVLEHVFDTQAFLTGLRGALVPGGLLLLTTLTVSGFDIQVLWERSKSVHPPHHLNLLSTAGLATAVARAGLEVVDLETPGELDVDIVVGMLEEDASLELPRFVRTLLDGGPQVRERFQAFLRANRLSSHVRVVSRRPS